MSTNILDEISEILNGIERYWINEKLAKQLIIEDLRNNEPKLISKLLSNKSINETYVQDIDGYKIFDKESLISMLRYKNYWQDSYTKYANKIGLTTEGKYLNYNSDVVLDFPFKDCILEGGMTKEDSILKNDEKFYNQVIAKDEIDTLLYPKVFTKIRKYDENGNYDIKKIKENDNLIIKGNNLITLYSLKQRYVGKVKLIYIDPPYNTGGDSFRYNDRFNRASWLTFMKNRLEVAKELLTTNGVIFVHCDNNEQSYLKVLLDDIFGEEQFIETLTIVNNPRGRDYGGIANMHEFIHVYAKSKDNYEIFKIPNLNKKFPYKDKISVYETRELRNRNTAFNKDNRPNLYYPFYINPNEELDNGFLKLYLEKQAGFIEVYPTESMGVKTVWRWGKQKSLENLNINIVGKKMKESGRYMIVEKYRDNTQMARSVWADKEVNSERGTIQLRELFGKKVFNFPKPEELISRIINIATKPNDIILDFFMGSGTTQAVAHKMNRQYIGIEQMNYINIVSVPRLQKVIDGEQSGISKDIEWQGGGSFIYAELAKENQEIMDRIISSGTKEELSQQIDKLLNDGILNYEVDFDKFTNTKKEFSELGLEDQKEVLIRLLDSNQLYVNYSDIEDFAYNFTEDEIAFNHNFYGGK
ncbi:site-specific DNA-methyltransferase [Staphylococcus epidermidis]|nr:site-specific DNA-methyltransferase [Staphylococcus epidermidis]MCG1590009.1 site-specific DNA-methyltransferase [Staphylococcus epidermidis]MCG2477981.1 site-specific DNA-methyltransferase [Staphylococcus epidermidis]